MIFIVGLHSLGDVHLRAEGRSGTRPGIGQKVQNEGNGDKEQWALPKIELQEWERLENVGQGLSKVTPPVVLKKQYHTFYGNMYDQKDGGPLKLLNM